MSNHNPGPWYARKGGVISPVAHPGVTIALVRSSWKEGRQDANAKIIAAAPEMLEALQMLIETLPKLYLSELQRTQVEGVISKATI